jgi:16S rRNA (guanine527-N7)-methyltransferase
MAQDESNMGAEFLAALAAAAEELGIAIAPDRAERMHAHFRLVEEANRAFNLTRITTPVEAAVRHYADSLSLLALPWVRPDAAWRVLDVGTGAGFPAVPLAIACPAWGLTAIDGTGKKVRFVAEACRTLGLPNVEAVHARAEDFAATDARAFDLVLARAVAAADRLIDWMQPLARAGGRLVLYKSVIEPGEQAALETAARRHRLRLEYVPVTLWAAGRPLGHQLIVCRLPA